MTTPPDTSSAVPSPQQPTEDTLNTITLMDPDTVDDFCMECPGTLPVHATVECSMLADLDPDSRDVRCDACELPWNEGVGISQHESCMSLYADGSRVPARAILSYRNRATGEWWRVERA